jgi:5'-phosphate synthase pdxT subunit
MIGVLSLQGDFAEHLEMLKLNGIQAKEVRKISDLDDCGGLIVPGGESTTIGKLLKITELDKAIIDRYRDGSLKIWGTCAGAILCASEVVSANPVLNLSLEEYCVARNAYGSQLDSFETKIRIEEFAVDCAFIRAPSIKSLGDEFEIIAKYKEEVVFARKGNLLISTCHPELYENKAFYSWLDSWFKSD